MSVKGFINVNKPSGVTSAHVVSVLKRKFNIKTIGHMGTLDPLANGILPIAIGRATRMFDYFLEKNKTYEAHIDFGYETDTLDTDGVVTKNNDAIVTKEQIQNVLQEFVGKTMQTPPLYSAKKVNGKKAYELARENVEFTLKPKEVEISEFILLNHVVNNTFNFKITCSSGTYIRSLERDLGYKLGTFGTISKLTRTLSGYFNIKDSYSLADIKESSYAIEHFITPIEKVFSHYSKITLNDKEYAMVRNGLAVEYIDKNNMINDTAGQTFVFYNDNLLGIAEIKNNTLKLKTFLE